MLKPLLWNQLPIANLQYGFIKMAGPVKQVVTVNFAKGVNTKVDPRQVQQGEFLNLTNSIFTQVGLNQKRNGYQQVGTLGSSNYQQITTLNKNLLAIGDNVSSYSSSLGTFQQAGSQLISTLSVVPAVRSQAQVLCCDSQVSNNLMCVAWQTNANTSFYEVIDATTGQNIVPPVALIASSYAPRVFILGTYFIVTYLVTVSAVNNIQYIAIPISTPATPNAAVVLVTNALSLKGCYDAAISGNGSLYFGYANASNNVALFNLNISLTKSTTVVIGSSTVIRGVTVLADQASPYNVWYLYTGTGSFDPFASIYGPTQTLITANQALPLIAGGNYGYLGYTGYVKANVAYICMQFGLPYITASDYLFPNWANGGVGSVTTGNPYLDTNTLYIGTCTAAGATTGWTVLMRGVGLYSKAFQYNGTAYVLVSYGVTNYLNLQPSYFLLNWSGVVTGKLAPAVGSGYAYNFTTVSSSNLYSSSSGYMMLVSPTIAGNNVSFAYLLAAQSVALNKDQAATLLQPLNPVGLFETLGANLVTFSLHNPSGNVEAGGCNHSSGILLEQYDQLNLVEHGFCVWPDDVVLVQNSSGNTGPYTYQYCVTYEWTDNQGNLHRSAPSIAVSITSNTTTPNPPELDLYIPTLRMTNKSNVRIVIYRWSNGQPIFYQITSPTAPLLNDPTVDFLLFHDIVLSDAAIAGNNILYTTGGVVDDIQAPACYDPINFHDRCWITTAENPRLLWFSKQNILNVPVEFSDQFTYYVAPTKNSSGPITAKYVMDEKLILFTSDPSILYVTGYGPDNTGQQNDLSQPVEIVTPVGCSNRKSIISVSNIGIFFQASNGGGIWLLDRSLNVTYKGAKVAIYNSANALSVQLIPGTTQIKYHMDNGVVMMYDYLVDEWEFDTNEQNNFGSDSVIYEGLHTYLDANFQIQQETPGAYLDQSNPINRSYSTSWIKLSGLQGYQRAYWFNMLGTYIGQHQLQIQINYDYGLNPNIGPQITIISPTSSIGEEWEIHFNHQQCNSFQLVITEMANQANPSAGFNLSGLEITVGLKKGYRPFAASNQTS